MPAKSTTIEEFFARLGAGQRAALEQLRRDIHAAAPGLEEVISYGVPGFKLGGRLLVWLGAGADHCSFYPGALPIARHASELERYETSKGTIRFAASEPLPAALVAALVQTRIAENAARASATRSATRVQAQSSAKATTVAKSAPAKSKSTTKRGGAKSTKAAKRAPSKATKRAGAKRTGAKRGSAKRSGTKRTSAKRGSAGRARRPRR